MKYVSGVATDVKHSVRDVFLGGTQVSLWAKPEDLSRTCVCKVEGYWVDIESSKDITIQEGDEISVAGVKSEHTDRIKAVSFKTKHTPKSTGNSPALYILISVLFLGVSIAIASSSWVRFNAGLSGWILTVIAMGLGFSFLQSAYIHWVAQRLLNKTYLSDQDATERLANEDAQHIFHSSAEKSAA